MPSHARIRIFNFFSLLFSFVLLILILILSLITLIILYLCGIIKLTGHSITRLSCKHRLVDFDK